MGLLPFLKRNKTDVLVFRHTEEFICKLQAVIGTFPDLTSLLLVTSVHATLLIIVHKSRFVRFTANAHHECETL
jgi:hypothetical protein